MKTVLIYGDSNVYGESAFHTHRVSRPIRWVTILQDKIGDEAEVIAEGFSGRTAGNIKTGKASLANGQTYFETIYGSHKPVDVLVIALGTNDCQPKYKRTANDIRKDLLSYQQAVAAMVEEEIHMIPSKVLYIVPPKFHPSDYFPGDTRLRNELADLMERDPNMNVLRIDTIDLSEDGVHFSEQGHHHMAEIVYEKIKEIL